MALFELYDLSKETLSVVSYAYPAKINANSYFILGMLHGAGSRACSRALSAGYNTPPEQIVPDYCPTPSVIRRAYAQDGGSPTRFEISPNVARDPVPLLDAVRRALATRDYNLANDGSLDGGASHPTPLAKPSASINGWVGICHCPITVPTFKTFH